MHLWGINYAAYNFLAFCWHKNEIQTVLIISVSSPMCPCLWNITYVSKMYRDEKLGNLHLSVRKLFWLLLRHWNFNSILSHSTAPYLPVHLSIICLRSHVGAPQPKKLKFAKITKSASRTPTCDRMLIIDNWTGKYGVVECDEMLLKFQWRSNSQKSFRTEKSRFSNISFRCIYET